MSACREIKAGVAKPALHSAIQILSLYFYYVRQFDPDQTNSHLPPASDLSDCLAPDTAWSSASLLGRVIGFLIEKVRRTEVL